MKRLIAIAVAAACGLGLCNTKSARAGNWGQFVVHYELQVEYWFFDTDHYYWKTVFSTTDGPYANWVYARALLLKEEGLLNKAFPSGYWRYIAVDVRLVERRTYINPGESSPSSGIFSRHQSSSLMKSR